MKKQLFYISTLVALISLPALAAEKPDPAKLPPSSAKTEVTFDKDIKPLFQKACADCHNAQKAKGGARFDTREGALKGGKHGSGVVVGDSAKSKLIADITGIDGNAPWMPTKKSKVAPLTKEEIGLVRAWIDQGAK